MKSLCSSQNVYENIYDMATLVHYFDHYLLGRAHMHNNARMIMSGCQTHQYLTIYILHTCMHALLS